MLQVLEIGQNVDDGTGDYLNLGGRKIKANFAEVYGDLGDGKNLFPAGAWRTLSAPMVNTVFGGAFILNTTTNRIVVNLPKGTTADYGKPIKLRDTYATWRTNNVTVVPAVGDTIKGNSTPVVFSNNYADLELVYCAPGRWEYKANTQVDRITSSDLSAVARKEFLATAGQTDFLDIFNGQEYNKANVEVYHRGNLLYYGDSFNDNSDFGSAGTAPTDLVELDGKGIRLRRPCVEGDSVIIISYIDGLTQWRSTYNRLELRVLDEKLTNEKTLKGSVFVGDLSVIQSLSINDFGYDVSAGLINPNTFEVHLNGVFQTEAGTGGLPAAICDGAEAENMADCIASGGSWVQSSVDYSYTQDTSGNIDQITFGKPLEHGDVITLKWFNNNIGTTLSMDEITDETDDRYITAAREVQITGAVRVTDFDNPTWPNVEMVPEYTLDVNNVASLFDIQYPVGSKYENFINPNNPATYNGGFGMWKLWGVSRVLVGWNPDDSDAMFNQNNNDLDALGNPSKRAGGTGGTRTNTLTNENLPVTQTDEKVLVSDVNGGVIIGGCQFDPDEQGPAYQKYREDYAITNKTHTPPVAISNVQEYMTVYRWIRIA